MEAISRVVLAGLAALALAACAGGAGQEIVLNRSAAADYAAPVSQMLTATTLKRYPAPDADQGVAVDSRHFYAIDNTVIAKHLIATGELVARWVGPRNGLVRHINSCLADRGELWCANSNYSLTPMGSSVEAFDARTLKPVATHSLGMTDEGSITWLDRYHGGWISGFAHYDENGGVPFKNHSFSSVVTFDASWRRTGGWLIPDTVLARMAPHAASGGAIGPDGLLYLLGHDRPELYVLAAPAMGPTLIHVATIAIEAEGQAFSWAPGRQRVIYAIDRRAGRVLAIAVPAVNVSALQDIRTFR